MYKGIFLSVSILQVAFLKVRSVLGPYLLFIIFVYDMPDVVIAICMLLMFADDIRLYQTITSVCYSNAL